MRTRGGTNDTTSTPDHKSESGAAAMSIIVVVSILMIAFAMVVGLRLSTATDEASELQSAADAAALAGAQSILESPTGQLVSALVTGHGVANMGFARAQEFANRNGATVSDYSYSVFSDRVEVTVRSKEVLESGEREERSAVAELGLNMCTNEPEAPETPDWPADDGAGGDSADEGKGDEGKGDDEDEGPAPQPELPEDAKRTVDCGPVTVEYSGSWGIDEDEHEEWTQADLKWEGWTNPSIEGIDPDLEPALID